MEHKRNHSRSNMLLRSFSTGESKIHTYGKKKPSHKSVLSRSQLDQQLWNQEESDTVSAPVVNTINTGNTANAVNTMNTATANAVNTLNTVNTAGGNVSAVSTVSSGGTPSSPPAIGLGLRLEPLELDNKENDFSSWEQETTQVLRNIKPRPLSTETKGAPSPANRTSSGSFKLARMAKALSDLSSTSLSSKDTAESRSRSDSMSTLHRLSIRSFGSLKSKRDSALTERASNIPPEAPFQQSLTNVSNNTSSMDLSAIPVVVTTHASYADIDNQDITTIGSSTNISNMRRSRVNPNLSIILRNNNDRDPAELGSPSTMSFESATSSSTPRVVEIPRMLAFKKETAKPRRVDKSEISTPTVVSHQDHFLADGPAQRALAAASASSTNIVPSVPPKDPKTKRKSKHKRGHRNGSSLLSSFSSHSSLFSLRSSKSKDPSAGSTKSQQLLPLPPEKESHHKRSISLAHRPCLSDVKRTIMSLSPNPNNFLRGNVSPSSSVNSLSVRRSILSLNGHSTPAPLQIEASGFDKSMISLPTPIDGSREKLRNKLKASNSLLSLAHSDTGSSLTHGVPVEEYQKSLIDTLLGLCNSSMVVDFEQYLKDVQSPHNELRKLAEASFSEVYIERNKVSNMSRIYKVIPFGNEELDQLPVQDIIQELRIARLLMSLDGYVDVIDAAVVQGTYPRYLLGLWDLYNDEKGSENYRPDFQNDQLYCVIVMSNAGTDLENFEINTWQEAESIFWQTVHCLKDAEEAFEFEHRDLHWGNIIVSEQVPDDLEETTKKLGNLDLDDSIGDIGRKLKVTLIDYTLSRASGPNGALLYTRLDHPDFYKGRGDYQFDIYRFMRASLASMQQQKSPYMGSPLNTGQAAPHSNPEQVANWALFCPKTNVLWLHYLVDKLINAKDLEKVGQTRSGRLSVGGGSNSLLRAASLEGKATSSHIDEEARSCKNLQLIHSSLDPRRKRFGKKGVTMNFQDFAGARNVLHWGIRSHLVPSKLNLY